MDRNAKLFTGVAVAAVLGAVAYFGYDVYLTRPRREPLRSDPAKELGVDRSSAVAPPFELAALDGSRISLAQLQGQVVFVNFWATWCPPCRDEMPSMVRLANALAAKHPGKFKMVAISVDDGWTPVKEYFAAPPFGGPPPGVTVALDTSAASARAFYCTARGFCPDIKFPETYIVDGKGKLVGYVVGPRDWSHPAAFEYLDRLIGS
jgi:thiol-disulfide isomerase/thioredoxin